MFKFESTDILNNIDVNALENNYAVNWEALDSVGFRFKAYKGEKDGTEYLLITAGRNLGMITRHKGVVEAVRVAEDIESRQALESMIEKNLDWRFYEPGSLSYTVQKPRAFLSRLLGKKAPNVGVIKEEVNSQLKNAQETLAKAKESLKGDTSAEATAANQLVDGLTQIVQAMTDDVNSPEVKAEESQSEPTRSLSAAVAAINYNGKTRAERLAAMRLLVDMEEYANDPALPALRVNLGESVMVKVEVQVEIPNPDAPVASVK